MFEAMLLELTEVQNLTFYNSFMEIKLTYHKIHPFKVYTSMVFI